METCHILVVEDDQDINNLLCKILTGAGYRGGVRLPPRLFRQRGRPVGGAVRL